MPQRDANQKAARKLQAAEGIGYQEALNRVRGASAEPPASASAYVLQPTAAEAALGITAEALGVRALPDTATPEQRAHAEAVWRPAESDKPCRCSGAECHHGEPCEDEESALYPPTGGEWCRGHMQHVDRHPGSMFGLTDWYDVYVCDTCPAQFGATVSLPAIPWGEVRNRAQLDGSESTLSDGLGGPTVTVIYAGIRHPNFLELPDEDEPEEGLDDEGQKEPLPHEARKIMTEEAAIEWAREVWPEAEGFEPAPGGWTFRVGGGYAWITSSGHVAADPEGLRSHARRRITAN